MPVQSPPHGIDSNFLCSKIDLDLQKPSRSRYTFGLVFSALTDKQIANSKKSDNAYETAQSTSEEYNSLRTEVYEKYVSNAEFENFQGEVNQKFEDLGALNPEDYATKEDLEGLSDIYLTQTIAELTYATIEEFKALEERVKNLEDIGDFNPENYVTKIAADSTYAAKTTVDQLIDKVNSINQRVSALEQGGSET